MISLDRTIWILLEIGNNFQATCHKVSLNALVSVTRSNFFSHTSAALFMTYLIEQTNELVIFVFDLSRANGKRNYNCIGDIMDG